ncbi:MAG TPA: SpoIIE family protein phosphatase, partial [Candidatus Aminicenantes bacterium]|nr:SpoIIE family protein phosphatase [Candidatus Aminicenantes bacterium]
RYDIIRAGHPLTLTVQAARIGITFQVLEVILFALLMTGLGLLVALRAPHLPDARLFSLALLVAAPTLAQMFYGSNDLFSTQLRVLLFVLTIALVFHTQLIIPHRILEPKRARRFLIVNYGVAGLCLLFIEGLILFGQRISILMANALSVLVLLVAPLAIAVYLYRLTHRLPKAVRRIRRLLSWAWLFFFAPLLVNNVAGLNRQPLVFNLAFLLALAVPLTYFYLLFRHRLFGLGFVIRRSVLYTVFSAVLGGFWLYAFINALGQINLLTIGDVGIRISHSGIEIGGKSAPGFSERPLIMAAGILAFAGCFFLWRLSRRWLAREFFKDEYDYHQILTDMAAVIATKLTVDELARAVAKELPRLMKLKGLALLVREGDTLALRGIDGFTDAQQAHLAGLDLSILLGAVSTPAPVCSPCAFPQLGEAGIHFIHPLLLKDEVRGWFLLGEKQSEDNYRTADLTLIEALSRQVAVALENNRLTEIALETERMARDLELARRIQQHLLPVKVPSSPQLDIAGMYLPANEVGGDYYDFLVPEGVAAPNPPTHVILADVTGKGIAAALFVTRIQGILRSAFQYGITSPRELLLHANHLSYTSDRKVFITVVCARFIPAESRAVFCRAGHLPILFQPGDGRDPELLAPGGIALGLSRNGTFADSLRELSVTTRPGDVFVLFSDGVTEARDEGQEEYGLARLERVVRDHRHGTAEEISAAIQRSLAEFCGASPPHDDSTLVVVKAPAG